MLPFLKPKTIAHMVITKRKSDGGQEPITEDSNTDDQGLTSAAEDLIQAVTAKDAKAVASALRSAFDILDSEPHEEGPQINEDKE